LAGSWHQINPRRTHWFSPRRRGVSSATTQPSPQLSPQPLRMADVPAHQRERDAGDDGEGGPAKKKCKMLCSLGTGEVVHVLHFKAAAGRKADFEVVVQEIAHGLYHLEAGISDVRVCHPNCNEVCFILTFLSRDDLDKFRAGPEQDALAALGDVVEGGRPTFSSTGTLMPDTHTLSTLLAFLKKNVQGACHEGHDVAFVGRELSKWYPRPEEYEKYVHWDTDPKKYTRNLIFSNEHMDVLLMCWPPKSKSAIHSHESSSCWWVWNENSTGAMLRPLLRLPSP